MLISIWNYLRGYVMIEVVGFSVERFLNLAVHRDVYVWDVERRGNKLTMKVGAQGYKMLKPCARKTGCKMKIINKTGMPFIKHRYRKRKMIPVGILIFIILIYSMASFVWLIEVEGNEKVNSQEIVEKLLESGYKVGGLKRKMNLRNAEEVLMNSFTDILWTGISFEGTKLVVEITETVPEPELVDYSSPSNIIANSDALILEIVTRKGTPKVKEGDTVRKGDVLVSGQILLSEGWEEEEAKIIYTRASADITAKTNYTFQTQLPLKKIEKEYTGQVKKRYGFRIINNKINFYSPNIPFKDYDHVINSKQLQFTSKFPLPFYIIWDEYIEYKAKPQIISDKIAQDTLIITLHDLLAQNIHVDGEIVKQEVKFAKKDGIMIGRLQAIVKEELGVESKLSIDDGRKQVNDKESAEH